MEIFFLILSVEGAAADVSARRAISGEIMDSYPSLLLSFFLSAFFTFGSPPRGVEQQPKIVVYLSAKSRKRNGVGVGGGSSGGGLNLHEKVVDDVVESRADKFIASHPKGRRWKEYPITSSSSSSSYCLVIETSLTTQSINPTTLPAAAVRRRCSTPFNKLFFFFFYCSKSLPSTSFFRSCALLSSSSSSSSSIDHTINIRSQSSSSSTVNFPLPFSFSFVCPLFFKQDVACVHVPSLCLCAFSYIYIK